MLPSSAPESSVLSSFIYALKSPESQRQYPGRLKLFFDYIGLTGSLEEQAASFVRKAKENVGAPWLQDTIIKFINHHKQRVQRKELSSGTLHNYHCAIKLFCEMNDLDAAINWKRITRGMPKQKVTANDRAPTIEEIRTLVEYQDRRIKALVYVMCSSGIRLGAWANQDLKYYLRWKDVTPCTNSAGEIVAAKLVVYAGEPEEYYTFITPEAYKALKDWIDFRARHGEKITEDSPLMRDLWQMSNVKYGAKWGLATNPKPLQIDGIKKILNRALWVQGLRKPLLEGKRRHEWKTAHGFRKFFKTRAEQVMRPLNVELLLGHDAPGMNDYYYRPTEQEVLNDYLKAADDVLIINYERATLKQVKEQTEKSEEELYILKGKLAQREKELKQAKEMMEEVGQHVHEIDQKMDYLMSVSKKKLREKQQHQQ